MRCCVLFDLSAQAQGWVAKSTVYQGTKFFAFYPKLNFHENIFANNLRGHIERCGMATLLQN